MKRVWIAVCIIVVAIGLCIWEQIYVKDFYTQLDNMVEIALENPEKDMSGDIKRFWENKNDLMYFFSQHELLNEIASNIEELEQGNNVQGTLIKIKSQTKIYYENQRLTPSNIF